MVEAVRRGMSQADAARRWRVHRSTVRRWVDRAAGRRLDHGDWESRSRRPHATTRTLRSDEDLVLAIRAQLRDRSVLGEYGADAILRELQRRPGAPRLSRATISRILVRRGAVEKKGRVRRRSPPPGWYLPDVARGEVELDSFDYVEDLVIRGRPRFDVLTGISLRGGLPAAFLHDRRSAKRTVEDLVRHWRRHGRPAYAQFDNGVVFQGALRHPDTMGRVTRLCLSLDVIPVFAPPREHGVQNLIESFNSLWQRKVWRRRYWRTWRALKAGSEAYVEALLARRAPRCAEAPPRRPFPEGWQLDLNAPFRGRLVFLRRVNEHGRVHLLGRSFAAPPDWSHGLVRAVVDLDAHMVHIWGLQKRAPTVQPLLRTHPHQVPQKRFRR